MLTGEDLVIQLFFWTSAFLAVVEAVKAAGWRIWTFTGLAAVLFLVGLLWGFLKEIYPPLTGWITSVATNPQSWFLLIVLFFVLVAFTGRAKKKTQTGIDPTTEALNKALQELFERVGRIESLPASATLSDHGNLVTTVLNLTKDTDARIDRLASNSRFDRDILILMNFALHQSAALLLESLLKVAPVEGVDSPLQLGGSFNLENESKAEFLELVRRKLDAGADRRGRFEGVVKSAEYTAEHEVEQTPMESRPTGIDPLALRKWAIVHRQCTRTVAFLQHEKLQVEEGLLAQRHDLLERFSELNN
ncbi:MAG: hypothetical protein EKK33_06645 [Bradyrhizobiaceae bacterium]|nr:MAG: hypothetical protein EKK33_06645 [Bradyrhizobiaceae bacterium]